MEGYTMCIFVTIAVVFVAAAHAHARNNECNVWAKTDAGWVCGLRRTADDGSVYASFRGVPYAKQPLGELRFKELEPLEPWDNVYDATIEGPVCYQTDVLYGKIMKPRGMSEACIHANIHVPIEALPDVEWRRARELQPPRQAVIEKVEDVPTRGLPIFVFIHGGGFAFGSGDSDLHGPEYLVSKKVIIITFNYRLNVFGFLSLNTTNVPGNAGLRDMVTLLRWVQNNARAFGGDPDNVTLGGQSAGAIAAHLLTLSKAAVGLFKRTILMSGTAISSIYSSSPYFAHYLQTQLLEILAINTTNPDDIYQQLIDLPAEKLYEANKMILDANGLTTFVPTVETAFPDVTAIIDDYPDNLLDKDRGKDIPLLLGYTNSECETFRRRFEEFNLVQKVKDNPFIIVPPQLLFTTPPNSLPAVYQKLDERYYNGQFNMDTFVRSCNEGFYEYPVLKISEIRGKTENTPIYVYRFSYDIDNSVIKESFGLHFAGAGHIEDLTYIFKANSVVTNSLQPKNRNDGHMRYLMTDFFKNFMTDSKPIPDETYFKWPATTQNHLRYKDIRTPKTNNVNTISSRQREIIKFFNNLTIVE